MVVGLDSHLTVIRDIIFYVTENIATLHFFLPIQEHYKDIYSSWSVWSIESLAQANYIIHL